MALYSLTNVPPERQKILGLVKGTLPSDEIAVLVDQLNVTIRAHADLFLLSRDLKLASGRKFTLVGTPQGEEIKDPSRARLTCCTAKALLIFLAVDYRA